MGDERCVTARLPLLDWGAARIRETVPKSLPGEEGACPSYGLKLSLRKFGRNANIAVPKLRRTPALSDKLSGPINSWPVLVMRACLSRARQPTFGRILMPRDRE